MWHAKENFCLTIALRLHDDCMMTAWWLHDDCMTTAWQLHDDYLTTEWQLHDDCLTTAWRLTDDWMTTAWQLPDDCLTTAWWLHNLYMTPKLLIGWHFSELETTDKTDRQTTKKIRAYEAAQLTRSLKMNGHFTFYNFCRNEQKFH